MQKYDIMGAAIQGQMTDSASNEVLAEFVALRGNNGKRMEFKEFDADIKGFGVTPATPARQRPCAGGPASPPPRP